jgi:hypothetical protein
VDHEALTRVTTARTKYGGSYAGRHGGQVTDSYEGEVAVNIIDPSVAWAGGTVRMAIDWPEASVVVESRLHVGSTVDEFRVLLDIEASESGQLVAARSWTRTFPRRLA